MTITRYTGIMSIHRPPLLVIIGTTASGKSDLAVDLALRYGGEVVSADSRQVYRGLCAATGRITEEEMKGVRHHLLANSDPGVSYNVHTFIKNAVTCVEDIYLRGSLPIIVGGTGFYIENILYKNILSSVPADSAYRSEKEHVSLEVLRRELRGKDSEAYKRIDTHNPRRIIRALEVIRSLGTFPMRRKTERYSHHLVGLRYTRQELRERIIERLDSRFRTMTEEVRSLLNDGVDPDWFERLGLDCRYMARMLIQNISEETTYVNILRANLAYAKRQETWWKRFPKTVWYREFEHKKLYTDLDALYGKKV